MANWQIKCVNKGNMIVASGTGSASSYEIPKNIDDEDMVYSLEFTGDSGCSTAVTYVVKSSEECIVCNPNPSFSDIICDGKHQTCTITTTVPCTIAIINFKLTDSSGNNSTGGVNVNSIGEYTFTLGTQMEAGDVTVEWWNTRDTSISGTTTITSPGICITCSCSDVSWPSTTSLTWNASEGPTVTKTIDVTHSCGEVKVNTPNGFTASVSTIEGGSRITVAPTSTNNTNGDKTATLTLTFNDETSDCSDTKSITLTQKKPSCDITITPNPSSLTCTGGTVTFTVTDNTI